ncbi:hypothetical protein E2C01_029404 [Portunus trituberculatus]|uniref:Uncharacterized protein n=1 Tax=Portunus trituberculatus TaxID=210409 RepID=A0A5B7ERD3_PORTR|nr:hypothetical protein [Portunus trituberculatus]
MQQNCVLQKNTQNKRLLWEALLEGNPPFYSDLKMTSRRPGSRETTYWDDNGNERWLPWTGYLVPMRTNRFKRRPHMMRMFVNDRAETPLPKHPSLNTQPSSTGRPLLGDPYSGWLRWSTGSLRRNLTSMGSPLPLERAEQGTKPPLA